MNYLLLHLINTSTHVNLNVIIIFLFIKEHQDINSMKNLNILFLKFAMNQ
jgi:hypothetical protein